MTSPSSASDNHAPGAAVPPPTRHAMERIAHRGGNSRTALRAASEGRVDRIEIDLWYHHGQLAVRHERRLWRLPVLYDSWHIRPHLHPLLLEEIVDLARGGPRLYLDFKGTHAPLASSVVMLLRRLDAVQGAAVCGQFWRPLAEIARLEPRIEVYYSLERRRQLDNLRKLLASGLRPAGVSIAHWLVSPEIIAELHQTGTRVFVWTVNQPELAASLVAAQVDGIISDRVDLLARLP